MKHFYLMIVCLIIGSAVSAQNSATGSPTEPRLESHTFTSENIYYKDNIVAHFKQYNCDVFTEYPDFPKYVDTQNINADCMQYHKRVFGWIKNHPDFMKRFNLSMETVEKEESKF